MATDPSVPDPSPVDHAPSGASSPPLAAAGAGGSARPSRLVRWWQWLIAIGALGLLSIAIGACTDGRTVHVTASRAANVATFTTQIEDGTTNPATKLPNIDVSQHMLQVGDAVTIAGVGGGFDGPFTVTAVPPPASGTAPNSFRVANAGPDVPAAGGAKATVVAGGQGGSWWEAMLLGWLGGLIAWGSTSLLLWLGRDRSGVGLLMCIGFLLSPLWLLAELSWLIIGAVVGRRLRFHASPSSIILLATLVGWYGGTLDGTWGTRDTGGVVAMLLDYGWGLSGSTNATIFHLVDGPSQHVKLEYATGMSRRGRTGTHQYLEGFRIRDGSVTTEGCVMTHQLDGAANLFDHELQHVWQNRCFGPIWTPSYVLWFATLTVPGLVAGIANGDPAGGVNDWAYANNPWESWGYSVGGSHSGPDPLLWGGTGSRGPGTEWNAPTILSFAALLVLSAQVLLQAVLNGWLGGRWRWWRLFGDGGGVFLMRTFLFVQNLALNALIALGFAAVSKPIAIVVVAALALQVLALVEPVAHRRAYQALLAWSALLLPTSLIAHLLGALLLIANLIGAGIGAILRAFEGMREADPSSAGTPSTGEYATAPPRASERLRIGGWSGELVSLHAICVGGWVGRLHPIGVNFGAFSFVNPAALARPEAPQRADRQFFTGLLLNNAAFGHVQATRWFDAAYPDQRAAFWDATAESRVDAGLRQHAAFAAETAPRPRIPQWGPGDGMGLMASRPEFFIALGALIVLMIVWVALVAIGWPGAPVDCLTGQCFCERAHSGGITQPIDTVSSLGFVVVGLVMLWRIRDPARAQPLRNPLLGPSVYASTYGAAVMALGVAGLFFHASLRTWADAIDATADIAWLGWAIAYDLVRANGRRQGWVFLVLWATIAALGAVLAAIGPNAGKILTGIAIGAAVLFDVAVVSFSAGGVVRRQRWWAMAVGLWIVAFVIWVLSGGKLGSGLADGGPLCAPDSIVQGHAVWHLLCAAAAWLYWIYLRSENPPPTAR